MGQKADQRDEVEGGWVDVQKRSVIITADQKTLLVLGEQVRRQRRGFTKLSDEVKLKSQHLLL